MVSHEFKSQRPVGARVGARVSTAALSLLKAAEVRSLAGHRARITLQALERGHGRTLGQALRRGGVFGLSQRNEASLVLRKLSPGPVTAGAILALSDAVLLNPGHVIAHLDRGAKLDLQGRYRQALALDFDGDGGEQAGKPIVERGEPFTG